MPTPAPSSTELYPIAYWLNSPWSRRFYKEVLPLWTPGASRKPLEAKAMDLLMPEVLRRIAGPDAQINQLSPRLQTQLSIELAEELKGLLAWGDWTLKGRRTIKVAPALALELAASRPGELTLQDVLTHDSKPQAIYVHFGLASGQLGRIENTYEVEGAYVIVSAAPDPAVVRVQLVGRDVNASAAHAVGLRPPLPWQGRYDLRMPAETFSLPVDEAVAAALAADLEDIETARRQASKLFDNAPALDLLHERMTNNAGVYERAIVMLVNTLAYSRWVEAEGEPRWPADAPASLVSRLADAKQRQRETIEDKLWNLGVTRVATLGAGFESAVAQAMGSDGEGGSVRAPHLRDGHWRNQAHGPRLSLRKLLWIRPTMVGGRAP